MTFSLTCKVVTHFNAILQLVTANAFKSFQDIAWMYMPKQCLWQTAEAHSCMSNFRIQNCQHMICVSQILKHINVFYRVRLIYLEQTVQVLSLTAAEGKEILAVWNQLHAQVH